MFDGWWELFAAAIGGGASFKLLEILYKEATDWWKARSLSARGVTSSLEPLVKSADELVGKLRSLAEQDFIPVRRQKNADLSETDFASLVFLFVQFWSWVEVFRMQSFDSDLGGSARGRQIASFLDCLESRRVRIIDRASQRATGEAAILEGRPANFVQLVRLHAEDAYTQRWLAPLIDFLARLDGNAERQRLLQYQVVLHAMIDTLDPKHIITKDRPGVGNKLSKNSLRALKYRVFGVYLTFVKRREKYLGPPNRRP